MYDKGRVLFTKENEKSIEYSLKSKQTTLKTTLEGKWNLTIYLNHLDAEWKVKDTIIDFSSINKKKYIHFNVPWHCFVRACSLNTAEKKPR